MFQERNYHINFILLVSQIMPNFGGKERKAANFESLATSAAI